MPAVSAAIASLTATPLLLAVGGPGWTTHTVRDGDTLWDIAGRHHTDVRTLIRANHLSDGGHLIRAGARLRVPRRAGPAASGARTAGTSARTARYVVRAGDTVSELAGRLGLSPGTLLRLNHLDSRGRIYAGQYLRVPASAIKPAARTRAARAAGARIAHHTVRGGDTLGGIALRYRARLATVLKLNHLHNTSTIYPGQRLRVPSGDRSRTDRSGGAAFDRNTFAGRTYASAVVRAAETNRARLADRAVPGPEATRRLITRTARRYGVDPALALAIAQQESGFDQRQVSVANAIGTMQVIPSSGRWAGALVGRRLDLLDTHDNVIAGVVILRALTASAANRAHAVAGYYQGLASVRRHGMYPDTERYVANVLALRHRFS